MDLILWRHAEAVDGSPDLARSLTRKGGRQARDMAHWLQQHLPHDARLIASTARRSQQTMDALGRDYDISEACAPDRGPEELLAAAGWPDAGGTVVVVGHRPALNRAAALLLSGQDSEWVIRKGAIWWFTTRERDGEMQVVLHAAMSPSLLAGK